VKGEGFPKSLRTLATFDFYTPSLETFLFWIVDFFASQDRSAQLDVLHA